MKKGRRIHPCPPAVEERLAALPIAVAALAAALPREDREVLAYLLFIGCSFAGAGGAEKCGSNNSNNNRRKTTAHVPRLGCTCFACYTSFWARWDASPNRHVIHRALEAFEETVPGEELQRVARRRRRKCADVAAEEEEVVQLIEKETNVKARNDDEDDDHDGVGDVDDEKSSSLKRLMNFIAEKVWGGWKN